jgi:formamidopyrimidine-DNA glycosylase
MPELPEVETVVVGLRQGLVGRSIRGVSCSGKKLRRQLSGRALARASSGARVLAVRRRGKYVIIDLTGGHLLLVHLGMSGRLELASPPAAGARRPAHTHVVLDLGGRPRRELRFVDPRRFGLFAAMRSPDGERCAELRKLGPDPFDARFTPGWLSAALRSSRSNIKSFLLDQRRIAGVGNIYASEALFAAGIDPRRPANRVGETAAKRLSVALRDVLAQAISRRGTSLRDYVDAFGQAGDNQPALLVYGRQGEPCSRCGTAIERIQQAGRSTFLCRGCQR